ncbi:MAG TPA: ATP-binding cassette domain-containing protein [Propionicimonas sp.]|jgi:teichoic acid transport system ATP-binding protein|nr:ATP-binding cassette domain-containing protein [Propionicimonas sp.]
MDVTEHNVSPTAAAGVEPRPVVVVDDLHVKYRVFISGKAIKRAAQQRIAARGRGIRTVHALRGVSFVARENESIGVIGPNGSGKSTLMRALTGLTPPAAGAVYASTRPNLLGVGAALIPDLSGDRNITLGCLALGLTRKEVEEVRDEIIDYSTLRRAIDLPMRTYSSGMQAKLKFAIATVREHEILIVDEALAVGDKAFRRRSEARIREIRDNAGTVFLVSHSMTSIRDTCSRTLWLQDGLLVMDGPTDEVVAAYEESTPEEERPRRRGR